MQIVKIFQGSRAGAVRANGRGASGSLQQSCNPERPMKVRLDCRSWWNWSHTEMQSTWFVACHSNVWSSHALNVEWVFEASASRCPAQVSLVTGWTLRFLEKDLAPKSMLNNLFTACTAEALAKQEPAFWNSQCAVAQLSMQNQYLSMICAYIAGKSMEIRRIDWKHTGPKHAALHWAFLQVAWNQFTVTKAPHEHWGVLQQSWTRASRPTGNHQ